MGLQSKASMRFFLGEEYQEKLLEQYQEKLEMQFFSPAVLRKGFSLSAAKKVLSEFKTICSNQLLVISLNVHYVGCCVEFIDTFGYDEEQIYTSLTSIFADVANKLSCDKALFEYLQPRLVAILETAENIGWGVHEYLCEEYYAIPFVWDENKVI